MKRNLWKFCSRVRKVGLEAAREYGLDAFELIEAVLYLQREEEDSLSEIIAARKAARKETGLTLRMVQELEDAGKDYTVVRGLDGLARELAGAYPALGLGEGYAGSNDVNHAEALWEMLRREDPVVRSQHDLTLVREAAEMMVAARGRHWSYCDVVPF